MSSPFSTFEELEGAIDGPTGGAIYTFAHMPAVNTIALLICVGLFLWFAVATFSTHYEESSLDRSINNLSVLILAGLLSLAGVEQSQTQRTNVTAQGSSQAPVMQHAAKAPVGLLGLMGLGGSALRRSKSSRHSPARKRRMVSRKFKP